jgi:tRNA nucleotidyltransferase (CCA-adding enzyme)
VEQRPPEPLLLGRHLLELGVAPGPQMGEITRAVYEMQLDGRVRNLDDAIVEAKKLVSRG